MECGPVTAERGGPDLPADIDPQGTTNPSYQVQTIEVLMTVPEVCKLLRLGRSSVYQGLRTGAIPGARHIGRALRIHRPTLEAWLKTGDVPPRIRGQR